MAQHSDQLFPGRDFLAREFARQPLEQIQLEGPPLQDEGALREVKCFLDAVDFCGEQTIALALPPRRAVPAGACVSASRNRRPLQAAAAAQQVPRGDVRVGDALVRIDQHQRDRRVLHHGIEQQLALHEVRALRAQRRRQFVVRRHQIAELVVAVRDQRHAEIPFAVARHRARQRAQHLLDRPHDARRQPEHRQQRRRKHQQPARTRDCRASAQPRR